MTRDYVRWTMEVLRPMMERLAQGEKPWDVARAYNTTHANLPYLKRRYKLLKGESEVNNETNTSKDSSAAKHERQIHYSG